MYPFRHWVDECALPTELACCHIDTVKQSFYTPPLSPFCTQYFHVENNIIIYYLRYISYKDHCLLLNNILIISLYCFNLFMSQSYFIFRSTTVNCALWTYDNMTYTVMLNLPTWIPSPLSDLTDSLRTFVFSWSLTWLWVAW